MKNKQVKVLYPFTNSSYQFFLQDMADSLVENGFAMINPLSIAWPFRHIMAKIHACRRISCLKANDAIIVLAGGYVDAFAFPFCYTHEIIPVLWDTWPRYWGEIVKSFKRNNVKLAFFTQKQTAEYVQNSLPTVKCVHLPEGVKVDKYKRSLTPLIDRSFDVLEMGRVYDDFHNEVITTGYECLSPRHGQLLFPTFESLLDGLNDAKLVSCFPRCMTHQEHAGKVETLTQRYWECMLSKNIIIGHAPKELVELLGYNPVVEYKPGNLKHQLSEIFDNIEEYQRLVDDNFQIALQFADWKERMPLIIKSLKDSGYVI